MGCETEQHAEIEVRRDETSDAPCDGGPDARCGEGPDAPCDEASDAPCSEEPDARRDKASDAPCDRGPDTQLDETSDARCRFAAGSPREPAVFRIGYRTPFAFGRLLAFLRMRAIEGVEAVCDEAYLRTVRLDGVSADGSPRVGWIEVVDEPSKDSLSVTVAPELLDDVPAVLACVRRLFDTDCSPSAVEAGLADFYERTAPENRIPGIRLPCCFDGFEMAVRAILGQQITVKAASTLAGRVAREFGYPVETPHEQLAVAFPPPAAFCFPEAANRLGELGVIRQRSRAICALAEAVCAGEVRLCPGTDLEAEAAALKAVPGIGDWTVQYLLMRAYAHPDAFPAADLGVRGAFPDLKPREIAALSERWRPWRSYAVMSLWSAHTA